MIKNSKKVTRLGTEYHPPGSSGQGITKMMERRYKRKTVINTSKQEASVERITTNEEDASLDRSEARIAKTQTGQRRHQNSLARDSVNDNTSENKLAGQSQI